MNNFAAEQPYQHAVYYLAVLLTEHSWIKQELLAATERNSILNDSASLKIMFYSRTYTRIVGGIYPSIAVKNAYRMPHAWEC